MVKNENGSCVHNPHCHPVLPVMLVKWSCLKHHRQGHGFQSWAGNADQAKPVFTTLEKLREDEEQGREDEAESY